MMGTLRTRRVNQPGDPGAYDVYDGELRVGAVVTDVTRVWLAYYGSNIIAAVGTKHEALRALRDHHDAQHVYGCHAARTKKES